MSVDDIPIRHESARRLAQQDAEALEAMSPPGFRLERAEMRLQMALRNGLGVHETERLERLAFPEKTWGRLCRDRIRQAFESGRVRMGGLAVVTALGVGALVFWGVRSSPSSESSQWLVAEELSGPHVLQDGSAITLSSGARGRLSMQDSSVHFALDRGLAHFDVTPMLGRRWSVTAGPNEVTVVGTRFSVRHGPDDSFEVRVDRGAVAVRVAHPESTVQLTAGEGLEAKLGRVTWYESGSSAGAPLEEPEAVEPSGDPRSLEAVGEASEAAEPVASAAAASAAAASGVKPSAGARGASHADELRLLQQARQALSRHDYDAALRSVVAHRRRFPTGQLAEEREALRIEALRGLGRKEEAQRAAGEFRQRFPKSVLSPKLEGTPGQAP